MKNDFIDDAKLYEIIIETKLKTEASRDEINKYYTTILSAIISTLPFLINIEEKKLLEYHNKINWIFIAVIVIGLAISVSWILTLKRIYYTLKAIDKKLMEIEKEYNKTFITYVISDIHSQNSPGRISKQEMLVPYIFIIVFIFMLFYLLKKSLI